MRTAQAVAPAIVVTGASRGIGAAIARALAGAGFTVGCVSRSGDVPAISEAEPPLRSRMVSLRADVTDLAAVKAVLDEFAERVGSLTGIVNNAGIHLEARSEQMPREQWETVMSSNALATVLCCQAAYPHLVKAGGGLIVNIGSFFDKLGVKRNLAYCASKAAVGAVTRVLAVEWAHAGIRVIDVAPGYVLTDLNREALTQGPLTAYLERRIPVGRPASAEEIGAFVTMLYSAGAAFLNGETIYMDGGQSIAH